MESVQLGEIRAEGEGLRLAGLALPYGVRAGDRAERFEPRAFEGRMAGAVLRAQHQAVTLPLAAHPDGGLGFEERADGLHMAAELPDTAAARDVVALVRAGVATGLSVEFAAVRERREAGVRVIEAARLLGVAVVPKPAYQAARVEAREGARPLRRFYQ